jgi:hypothetical protein
MPSPATSLNILAPVGREIWAFGARMSRWDGRSWIKVPGEAATHSVEAVAAQSPRDIWEIETGALVRYWNGAAWSATRPFGENADLGAIAARSSRDVWVGVSKFPKPAFFSHWNGHDWRTAPSRGPTLVSVDDIAVRSDDAWALATEYGGAHKVMLRWNGRAWSPARLTPNQLLDLLAIPGGGIWTAGYYRGGKGTVVEHRVCSS